MKILLLDIENAPHLAYVWSLWKQNINPSMVVEGGYILSWAAKWYGDDGIMFASLEHGHATMINQIHKLLNEADAVIHYNGAKHDVPILNKEFLLKGLTPPSPYAQIDLIKTVRTRFQFPSNSLAYVVKALGIGEKGDSGGFKTWAGCMEGDPKAWEVLEEYNIKDVILLEKLYEKLKPWIRGHANISVYTDTLCCPTCGSEKFQRRGTASTAGYIYPRFRCKACGSWFRGRKNQSESETFIGV